MAWGTTFRVRLMTPEATRCEEGAADSAIIPLESGLMGILPNHARFLGRLGMGRAAVRTGHGEKIFLLEGGWVHIRDNVVEVVADRVLSDPLAPEAHVALERKAAELPSRTLAETARRRREMAWAALAGKFGR